jgi:hypothetical protein
LNTIYPELLSLQKETLQNTAGALGVRNMADWKRTTAEEAKLTGAAKLIKYYGGNWTKTLLSVFPGNIIS